MRKRSAIRVWQGQRVRLKASKLLTLTGAQILSFVGNKAPTADDTTWAGMCADAVTAAVQSRLNGAVIADASPAENELNTAMLLAGAEAYKRKEATFGTSGYADLEGNAIALARDYVAAVAPLIDRWSAGPGIG